MSKNIYVQVSEIMKAEVTLSSQLQGWRINITKTVSLLEE